jgi:uncharacterized protein YjbI with pentapeptide repeats
VIKGFVIIIIILLTIGITIGKDNYLDLTKINSTEIITKVNEGDLIQYDRVEIIGDLNFSESNLPVEDERLELSAPIKITNSIINGELDGSWIYFLGNIDFSNTVFSRNASFAHSKFRYFTNFDNAEFVGTANFDECEFHGDIYFKNSTFMGSSSFLLCKYLLEADFSNIIFMNDSIFKRSQYNSAIFYDTTFNYTDFSNCKFVEADFRKSRFLKYTNFVGADFGKFAQFGDNDIKNTIDLTNIKFGTLELSWDVIGISSVYFDANTFHALIKNYNDLGWYDDADKCYYDYRLWSQGLKHQNDPYLYADIIAMNLCGYGVRWQNTIYCAIGIIILFWFIFIIRKDVLDLQWDEFKKRLFELFTLSAIILISAPVEWYPFGKRKFIKYIRRYKYSTLIERLVGWGLMILFIGVISRLMIRAY